MDAGWAYTFIIGEATAIVGLAVFIAKLVLEIKRLNEDRVKVREEHARELRDLLERD